MDDSSLIDWLAFASLRFSPRHLQLFKSESLDIAELLSDEVQLRLVLSRMGYTQSRYQSASVRRDLAKGLLDWCQLHGWQVITQVCELYPSLLREIADPPLVLFCKGDAEKLPTPQLAMVGSRRCSSQGEAFAQRNARKLASSGLTVTSGLALGIDRAAHLGALETLGGTLAVMATGPDRVYPNRNAALADAIVESGGLLVTEKLPCTQLKPYLFPERNRLISGLSLGTLVVEANLKSGSLITAKVALEQGREVMAVPGALTNPCVRGCHQLIKQGAALVENAEDALYALYPSLKQHQQISLTSATPPVTDYPTRFVSILSALEAGPLSLDQLVLVTGLGISELSIKMMELELDGWVAATGPKYCRVR